MTFKILQEDLSPIPENAGRHWIRPMMLGSGWAAVAMWINDEELEEIGLFPEPWETGIGRYTNKNDAAQEAYEWAKAAEIPVFMDGCQRKTS